MDGLFAVEKVSIALGREELAWARDRAAREGTSVSAVLTEAARVAREAEAERARRDAAFQEFFAWATDRRGVDEHALNAAARELAER